MKKSTTTTLLIFCALSTFSQNGQTVVSDSTDTGKKYVIWISPSHATHVYGLMFNFWPRPEGDKSTKYPKIYGSEINLVPLGLFFPFILAVHVLARETHQPTSENVDSLPRKSFKKIYGLQIGLTNMEPSIINGLDINASGSFDSKTNGVTISAIMNKHHVVNGLTTAIIGNHDTKCHGVQVGLINSCKQLRGFQLGLWNKNQKRSLPLINWCCEAK